MKITVVLPSRNRPAGLLSVLKVFDALSSGENEITYAVVVDDDDYGTLQQFEDWEKAGMLPDGVQKFIGARNKTVNARFNEAVKACPAEVYSQACDDAYPLAHRWDKLFQGAKTLPGFCWQEVNDPANCTYPILTDRWVNAVGRFYPEYFPFWFADTWIAEVFNLTFSKPIPVVNQLQVGGKRGQTQGMRDLAFWFKFFAETRVERMEEAKKIAKSFGFTLDCERDRVGELSRMREGDAYQLTQVPRYETVFKANLGEPSEVYKQAKRNAEEWLDLRIAA